MINKYFDEKDITTIINELTNDHENITDDHEQQNITNVDTSKYDKIGMAIKILSDANYEITLTINKHK